MRAGTPQARRPGIPEAFALVAALSWAVARFVPVLDAHLECPFRSATGLPCASCGMTHAFVALARGDVAAAFTASPLGAALAGGAWLYALVAALRMVAGIPWPSIPLRVQRALAIGAVSAVAVNWAWMLLRAVGA